MSLSLAGYCNAEWAVVGESNVTQIPLSYRWIISITKYIANYIIQYRHCPLVYSFLIMLSAKGSNCRISAGLVLLRFNFKASH